MDESMSQQQQRQAKKGSMANEIDGFSDLYPRQTTIHEWRVLSRRNDSVTAHKVDVSDLSCTCEDMAYNKEDNQVCDHVAAALFACERTMDVQAALDHEMRTQMLELKDSVRAIERRAAGVQADIAHEQANATAGDSQPSSDEWTGDPVEAFKSLLRDDGLDPDDFDIWVHEDLGSLQVEIDGFLDDDEFQQWVDLSDGIDLSYDGDDDVNYLKEDRFPEVLG
jgi:hypothetical protein